MKVVKNQEKIPLEKLLTNFPNELIIWSACALYIVIPKSSSSLNLTFTTWKFSMRLILDCHNCPGSSIPRMKNITEYSFDMRRFFSSASLLD